MKNNLFFKKQSMMSTLPFISFIHCYSGSPYIPLFLDLHNCQLASGEYCSFQVKTMLKLKINKRVCHTITHKIKKQAHMHALSDGIHDIHLWAP